MPNKAIREFCGSHFIRKLSFFGSVLRDDFGPESDVDVLVEYHPGHVRGFDFISHQDELSRLLWRRVDLNTPNSLSKYFQEEVLSEAEVMYAET